MGKPDSSNLQSTVRVQALLLSWMFHKLRSYAGTKNSGSCKLHLFVANALDIQKSNFGKVQTLNEKLQNSFLYLSWFQMLEACEVKVSLSSIFPKFDLTLFKESATVAFNDYARGEAVRLRMKL